MHLESEGMILKQIKTSGERRMILLFTKKYGKISAGTSLSEKGKNKSGLSLRPFTYGNYDLFKKNRYYYINGAHTLHSFFSIGEDVDKYMGACYVLELLDKVVDEEKPVPQIFSLTLDFFHLLERREKKIETLILAYEMKLLQKSGLAPMVEQCSCCQSKENLTAFSVEDGGVLCDKCEINREKEGGDTLIFQIDFGIVEVLRYFSTHPLRRFENIGLDETKTAKIRQLMTAFEGRYLDLNQLNSRRFLWKE